jgi:hypothetical protein
MPMPPAFGALAAYKDFLTLGKDADPDLPIRTKPKPTTRSCIRGDGLCPGAIDLCFPSDLTFPFIGLPQRRRVRHYFTIPVHDSSFLTGGAQ